MKRPFAKPRTLEQIIADLEVQLQKGRHRHDYEAVRAELIAAKAALAARNHLIEEEATRRRSAFYLVRGTGVAAILSALITAGQQVRKRLGTRVGRGVVVATTLASTGLATAAVMAPDKAPASSPSDGNVPTGTAPGALQGSDPSATPSGPRTRGGSSLEPLTEMTTAATPSPDESGRAETAGTGTPSPAESGSARPGQTGGGPPRQVPGDRPGTGDAPTPEPGTDRPAGPPSQEKPDPPSTGGGSGGGGSGPKTPTEDCLLRVRLDPLLDISICLG